VKRVRRWTALTVVAVGVLWRPAPHLSAQARPQPVKSVRLYVFDLGMLKIPDPKNFGFKKEELALTDIRNRFWISASSSRCRHWRLSEPAVCCSTIGIPCPASS